MTKNNKNNKLFVYGLLTISVLFWAALSDAWGYSEHIFTGLPNASIGIAMVCFH